MTELLAIVLVLSVMVVSGGIGFFIGKARGEIDAIRARPDNGQGE